MVNSFWRKCIPWQLFKVSIASAATFAGSINIVHSSLLKPSHCNPEMSQQESESEMLAEYVSRLHADVKEYLLEEDYRRFLRARKWNVDKALAMTSNWWEWYNQPIPGTDNVTPRTVLDSVEDPKEHVYKQLLPHSNYGCSKHGHPIYWERTGQISSQFGEISKHLSVEDLVIRHIRQQEMAVRRMHFYSQKFGHLVESQIIVFNLANLSYSLDTNALSAFRKTLAIDQDYYPERLHTLFMINAPWFFTAIWAIISPWIDPVTANKIKIIGSDYLPALQELIDDEQIPVELGGKCDHVIWEWPFPDHTLCSPDFLSRPHPYEVRMAEKKASGESSAVPAAAPEGDQS
jgi:hypothetical protein